MLGVYQSQASAIKAIVAEYLAEQPGQVFLTGGGIEELNLACQSGWLSGLTENSLWPDRLDYQVRPGAGWNLACCGRDKGHLN